ncbi:MAG: hypothetical protein WD267_08050 [Balneolales bacterium]
MMKDATYSVIKNDNHLDFSGNESEEIEEEKELLPLLIETYDEQIRKTPKSYPITLLKSLWMTISSANKI